MAEDEKLFKDKIQDLYKRCERDCTSQFSNFLDEGEQILVSEQCLRPGFNTCFFGGFDDAERKIFGVLPEWEENAEFPLRLITIEHSFGSELSHRDYLGSVLGLGIERNKTGDILIDGNKAYVILSESIANFVCDNLKKIGSRGVKVKMEELCNVKLPEKKFMEIGTVCASLRLDAVVGAATNLARAKAANLIEAGYVKLNHKVQEKGATQITEGDLISVRGYGRFVLSEAGNETRKGRIHIVLKKYI